MAGPRAQLLAAKALANLKIAEDESHFDQGKILQAPATRSPSPEHPSAAVGSVGLLLSKLPFNRDGVLSAAETEQVQQEETKSSMSSLSTQQHQRQSSSSASKQALGLNHKLQETLRGELRVVDDALEQNREALREAEKRLASNQTVGMTTSSEKFVWARSVIKFLATGGYPWELGPRREQEALLRAKPLTWLPWQRKARRTSFYFLK